MNLETEPVPIDFGAFNIILTGEEPTDRHIMSFDVKASGFPESGYKILRDMCASFEGPYRLRGYSGDPAFCRYRQSAVNLIGSIRESVEQDFRYAVWGAVTAVGLPGEGWTVALSGKTRRDVIRVAFDGKIYTFSASIVKGEGYREGCTTCEDGRRLLQIALNEINGAVVVDAATFDETDDTFEYGNTNRIKAIPGDTKLIVSNPRDFSDGVSSFPDWFREMNVGARDMASSEVYFSLI